MCTNELPSGRRVSVVVGSQRNLVNRKAGKDGEQTYKTMKNFLEPLFLWTENERFINLQFGVPVPRDPESDDGSKQQHAATNPI